MTGVLSMVEKGDEVTIEGETYSIRRIDSYNRLLFLEDGPTVHSATLHSSDVTYRPAGNDTC